MLFFFVAFIVQIKNMLNKESNLLILLLEIWSYASMGNTTNSIQIMIPIINNKYKKNCLCPANKCKRFVEYAGRTEQKKKKNSHTCHCNPTVVLDGQ